MSQQINLYNPAFRKRTFSFTSAAAMFYAAAGVAAVCLLIASYGKSRLSQIEARAAVIQKSYDEAIALNEKLTAEFAKQKSNPQLDAEIALLDAALKARRDVVETLQSGAIGSTSGFSSFMSAFARQRISGLWLTGFDIAKAGGEMAIQGRTLNSELVARYLQQLNRERMLQGRQFAAMRIGQPSPDTSLREPRSDKDADAKDARPVAAQYLEFTLSTMNIAEAPAAGKPSSGLLGPLSTSLVLDQAKAVATPAEAR